MRNSVNVTEQLELIVGQIHVQRKSSDSKTQSSKFSLTRSTSLLDCSWVQNIIKSQSFPSVHNIHVHYIEYEGHKQIEGNHYDFITVNTQQLINVHLENYYIQSFHQHMIIKGGRL